MPRNKKRVYPTLARLFKMTPEQLQTRRKSGGGVHKSGPKYKKRAEQKRRAINDELN